MRRRCLWHLSRVLSGKFFKQKISQSLLSAAWKTTGAPLFLADMTFPFLGDFIFAPKPFDFIWFHPSTLTREYKAWYYNIWKTRFVGSVEIQTGPTTRHWSLVIEKVFSPRRLLGLPLCGARHPVPWPTNPRKSLPLVFVTLLHPQKSPGRSVVQSQLQAITANVPLVTSDL